MQRGDTLESILPIGAVQKEAILFYASSLGSLTSKAARQLTSSLVPRPHPKKGERGLVNLDRFLGLAGSVGACRHYSCETNLESDWSLVRLRAGQ